MFDIERNERRERDALLESGDLPGNLDADVVVALRDCGFRFEHCDLPYPQMPVKSPPGWTRAADLANHQRFYLLDPKGKRRFAVFWKAASLFGTEPGYGGVAALPTDTLAYRWLDEGLLDWQRRERTLRLECDCGERLEIWVSLHAIENGGAERAEKDAAARFRAHHQCRLTMRAFEIRDGRAVPCDNVGESRQVIDPPIPAYFTEMSAGMATTAALVTQDANLLEDLPCVVYLPRGVALTDVHRRAVMGALRTSCDHFKR